MAFERDANWMRFLLFFLPGEVSIGLQLFGCHICSQVQMWDQARPPTMMCNRHHFRVQRELAGSRTGSALQSKRLDAFAAVSGFPIAALIGRDLTRASPLRSSTRSTTTKEDPSTHGDKVMTPPQEV